MLKYFLNVIILLPIVFLFGCKDSNPESPIVVTINGLSELVSLPFEHGNDYTISADVAGNNYGFDASSDSRNIYISVESGKSTSFRAKSSHSSILFEAGDGGLISITNGSIQKEGNIGINSSTGVGSQKLKVSGLLFYQKEPVEKFEWCDFENATEYDPTIDGEPIRVFAKVYNKTILPDVYIYKLYGTTVDVSTDWKTYLNKICSQAVAEVNNVPVDVPSGIDKNWDLNGNGKLDIWPDLLEAGTPDPEDEFIALTSWAGPSGKNYWEADKNGIVILDQEFVIHGSSGTIAGITTGDGKFVVIAGDASKNVVAHEYLHMLRDTKHLYDIVDDEYNLMYYLGSWTTCEVLRYREFTRNVGGKQMQWTAVNGATF